jgi:pimeloyl-ACP methyl ester carboxylesterase
MEDSLIGMTPVAFRDCFGWLHQAAGGSRGVVLCAASGYEALGAHQSWRVLADRLAAEGLPTLRFDYPGCGDSLGDGGGPGATEASISSIRQAAEFLREQTGVSEVALIGLRLGAAFALEAALADNAIDSLALVTPVLRGKSFLLEQKALAKVIAARGGANTVEDFSADRISIEGFEFDRDAIDAIMKIDLQSVARPPARRILIVGEPGSGRYDAFAEKLKSLGCAVARSELSEVGAWRPSTIPTPAPLEDIKSMVAWAREGARERQARAVAAPREIETKSFVESVLRFGEAERLVGVLCSPRTETKERGRPAMILLNTGANYHIGSGRTMVEHARFLAGRGHATLRMDCLGIGDSDWLPEGPLAVIHHEERAADVSQAIDALEAMGFDDISAAGVCSGAFLAFRSALKDVRIKRLLLVNPQFWLPLSAEQLADPRQGTFGSTSTYLGKALSIDAWRRVVEGQVDKGALLSILREMVARSKKALMSRFSKLSDPKAPLESELSALGERGCRTLLVLGAADSAREVFAEHMAAANMANSPKGLEVEIIQGVDHVFATREARGVFGRLLERVARPEEHEPSATGKESIVPWNGKRDRAVTMQRRESVSELASKPM